MTETETTRVGTGSLDSAFIQFGDMSLSLSFYLYEPVTLSFKFSDHDPAKNNILYHNTELDILTHETKFPQTMLTPTECEAPYFFFFFMLVIAYNYNNQDDGCLYLMLF